MRSRWIVVLGLVVASQAAAVRALAEDAMPPPERRTRADWLRVLADRTSQEREEAVEALERGDRDPAVVAAFAAALADGDPEMRVLVATALGLYGASAVSAAPKLAAALSDARPEVEAAAAAALLRLPSGGPVVEAALLARVAKGHEPLQGEFDQETSLMEVAAPIGRVLGRDGSKRAVATLLELATGATPEAKERTQVRRWAIVALGATGAAARPTLPRLVALLDDEDEEVSDTVPVALSLLGAHAADAMPLLLARVKTGGDKAAASGLKGLGGLGAPAVPALLEFSKDLTLQEDALAAIAGMGERGAAAVEPLFERLTSLAGDKDRADGHAITIAALGPAAVTRAHAALKARRSVAVALLVLQHAGERAEAAIPDVAAILGEPGSPDLTAAIEALAAIATSEQAKPFLPSLVSAATSAQAEVRKAGIDTLQRFDPSSDASEAVFLAALRDPEKSVRKAGAAALGSGKRDTLRDDAVAGLIAVLGDSETTVRLAAARALGRRHATGAAVVAALASALEDKAASVRRTVAEALAGIGPAAAPALPALQKAFQDANADVARAARKAAEQVAPK